MSANIQPHLRMDPQPSQTTTLMSKRTILILCTGNSCRSQMAEALLRHSAGHDLFEVFSAGGDPSGYVHPMAIEMMKELDLDLTSARSKNLSEYLQKEINTVVTVCGRVDQICPIFPGQLNRYHWPFDDPVHFKGTDDEIREAFRRVRNEIQLVCEAYVCGIRERLLQEA